MSNEEQWDLVIKPKTGWFDIHLGELWRYRDLVAMFVKRDFVTMYKQTILGPLWFIIQPFFTTLVFTIVFGKVAKIPTDNLPPFLFYLSGNVAWGYFATCLGRTSDTFNTNARIFGKVYFPRLTVPLSSVISGLLQFAIQLVLFLGFYFYFLWQGTPIFPKIWIIALPVLLLQMALLGFGMGILVSSMTTKYKDLRFAMGFVIQLWMYATPVVYPLTLVPDWLRPWYVFNPMVSVIECFRYAFLGSGIIRWSYVGTGWLTTLLIVFAGVLLFSRIEKTFMDTV
ncbi:MAG: ABC transporter permease [Candidatus Electrothrix aestuarii]|uniref:Transport permease protein n=1 Tax=Candidatus Electrothrix aestuarii TaxID=3062594 RepID=A0AAU8LX70_9BACT|nr:ABC transporter permease [Candidatus Electrothrix aestuarii]